MQAQNRDFTIIIENFIKSLISSLDQSYYDAPHKFSNNIHVFQSTIAPYLIAQSAIIINGTPFGESAQFQQLWSSIPCTQHNLLSFDTHLIPNTQTSIVIAHLKVRFDESGKSRLGETSDLISDTSNIAGGNATNGNRITSSSRPLWGNWFGVCLTLVIDENVVAATNNNSHSNPIPCISSFNYRFTEQPDSSVFSI